MNRIITACFLLIVTQQALSQTTGPTLKSYCRWRTFLGNGNDRGCARTWTYKGTTYNDECITVDHFRPWCSVTEGAFQDKWGNCDTNENCPYFCSNFTSGGTANRAPCNLPFRFEGVTYNTCTNTKYNRLWCATTNFYNGQWGNCEYNEICAPQYCVDRTEGGTGLGAPCVIPFTYKGRTYTDCTTTEHTRQWCSTTSTFEGSWGNCLPKECPPLCTGRTTRGSAAQAPCIFPFVYKGVTYNKCTTFENYGVLWCSTTPDYKNSWGNCVYADNC